MNEAPRRGLPPKTYVPIVLTVGVVIVAIVAYFLKGALTTTGGALAPEVQATLPAAPRTVAGVAQQQAVAVPTGEVNIPQSGGPGDAPAQPPAGAGAPGAAGPPAPVAQMVASLKERVKANPHDLAALVGLASLYFDAGKYAQAIPYYQRALALDPSNPDTRTDYATALHGAGRDLEALEQLNQVLAANPSFAPALFNEGIVAGAIGRRSQAIAAFKKFLAVAPRDPKAADARTAIQNLGGA